MSVLSVMVTRGQHKLCFSWWAGLEENRCTKADLAPSVIFEELSVLFCFVFKSWKQETGRNLKKAVESIASVHTVERNLSFFYLTTCFQEKQ